MSSLLQRLSLMAGVTLTEAQMQPKIQLIYIKLFDVGMEDQPDEVVNQFVAKAVETQDVLTVDDWRINHDTLQLEFVPMLRSGEVPMNIAKEFRDYMIDFLSDPENMDTYESVQEATGSNTPFDDLADWKAACKKAGCEVYSQGAADGKYTAKKDDEVYGRFNKESGEGWLHSSALAEDANYDDEGNVIPEGPLPQGLAEIARQLGFQTLDTRNSDSLDFKEVSVGGVKAALLAAYNLGKTQATAQATPAEQQPQSGGLPVPQGRTSADHQQAGPTGIAR